MAQTKVSALTALTTSDGAEELLINDGGTSKKITIANATASKLPLAGGTMTGTTAHGDNVQSTWGTGGDLVIYHHPSNNNSYIQETGAGSLMLLGTDIQLMNAAGTKNKLVATSDGAVTLYYNNAEKLATTNTGVDISGTTQTDTVEIGNGSAGGTSEILFSDNVSARGKIVYDHSATPETLILSTTGTNAIVIDNSQNVSMPNGDLDVTGSVTADSIAVAGASGAQITIEDNSPSSVKAYLAAGNSSVIIGSETSDRLDLITNNTPRLSIDTSGNVGIGTNSPTSYNSNADNLVIYEASDFSGITLASDNDQGSNIYFADPEDDNVGGISYNHSSNYMGFRINGAERMRLDSSGNVGIGTSTVDSSLAVTRSENTVYDASQASHQRSEGATLRIQNESTTVGSFAQILLRNQASSVGGCRIVSVNNGNDSADLAITTGDTSEAMRISSTSNVGIGDTDPSYAKLSIANVLAGDIGLSIVNTQDTQGIKLDQNGDGNALYIDSESANNNALEVRSKWGIRSVQDISGGYAAQFDRNLAEAGSYPLVSIVDNHTSNTQPALKIRQDGAGYGIEIDQNGNARALKIDCASTSYDAIKVHESKYGMQVTQTISGGYAANFNRNIAETGSNPLVKITDDNAANTQTALSIKQDGAGYGIHIDYNGNHHALLIDTEATTHSGLQIEADALTTGKAAYFYSNSASTSTRNLVEIKNDHASATGTTALYVKQDSTGPAAVFKGDVGIGSVSPNEGSFQSGSRVLSIQGDSADDFGVLELISTDTTGSNRIGELRFGNLDGGSSFSANAGIRARRDGADDAIDLSFWTTATGGSLLERLTIKSAGDVEVTTGNLVIGTAGKGIDFSAQTATSATGASSTSEVLDHYEEGTWTATWTGATSSSCTYTRIGRMVYASGQFTATGAGTSGDCGGLPFSSAIDGSDGGGSGYHAGDTVSWNVLKVVSAGFRFYTGSTQKQLTGSNGARFFLTYHV